MNTSQVTVAQRQFTTDVFGKIQERKDTLSEFSEKPTVSQYLLFQFVKREIGPHRPGSLI